MKLSAFYEFHPCCVGQSFAGLNVNNSYHYLKVTYEKDYLGRKNYSIILSQHPPTYGHTHTAVRLALNVLVMGWCFVSVNVFLFFSTHHSYLIQFLSAGTQTCCQQHCHHPCLDILEPPENDVLIFLCGRGWTEESGVGSRGLFFPSCLCIYLCPSTSHPLRVRACL